MRLCGRCDGGQLMAGSAPLSPSPMMKLGLRKIFVSREQFACLQLLHHSAARPLEPDRWYGHMTQLQGCKSSDLNRVKLGRWQPSGMTRTAAAGSYEKSGPSGTRSHKGRTAQRTAQPWALSWRHAAPRSWCPNRGCRGKADPLDVQWPGHVTRVEPCQKGSERNLV